MQRLWQIVENPMDTGAWWATVYGVTKSWIQLKQLSMHTHAHVLNNSFPSPSPNFFPDRDLAFTWMNLNLQLSPISQVNSDHFET